MANFSFTQLKTTQLSGSFNDGKSAVSAGFGGIAAANGHLQETLDHMASSLKRLHGGTGGISNTNSNIKAPTSTTFTFDLQDDRGLELRDGGTAYVKMYKSGSGVNALKSVYSSGVAGDLQLWLDNGSINRPSLVISGALGGAVVIPNSTNPNIPGLVFGDPDRGISTMGKTSGLTMRTSTQVSLSGSSAVNLTVDGGASGEVRMQNSAATDANAFAVDTFMKFSGNTAASVMEAAGSSRALDIRDGGGNNRIKVMAASDPGVQLQTTTPLYFNGAKAHKIEASSGYDFKFINSAAGASGNETILLSSSLGGVRVAAGSSQQVELVGGNVYVTKDSDQYVKFDGTNKIVSPVTDGESSLGSSALRWNKVYVQEANIEGDLGAEDIYASGQLYVSGTGQSVFAGGVKILGTLDVAAINTTVRNATALEIEDAVVLAGSGSTSSGAAGVGYQFGGTIGGTVPGSIFLGSSGATFEFDIGGTKYLDLSANALVPGADAQIDLGSSSVEWKDLHLDGIGYIDEVRADVLKITDVADGTNHLSLDWDERVVGGTEDNSNTPTLKLGFGGSGNVVRRMALGADLALSGAFTLAGSNASQGLVIKQESSAGPGITMDSSATADVFLQQSTKTNTVVTYGGMTGSMGVEVRHPLSSNGGFVKFMDADNSAFARLEAPATVGSSYTLKLPTAAGSAGQKLQVDGSGQLSFVSDSVASRTVYAHQMISGHAADVILNLDTSGSGSAAGAYATKPSIAQASPSGYIVFVNGQRMVSGSASANSSGNVDYTLDASATNSKEIKFSFPLVAGDIIMIDKSTSS